MGTRGHLGGLAETTLQALLVLDAAGKDIVFLETVGTGQSEVGVISIADTVVLALMPGLGRLDPGAEGRDHGDPRRDRDQQDGPPAREDDAERGAPGARARAARTAGGRRSCSPRRCAARASTRSGRRSSEHRAWLESEGELEARRRRNLAAEVFAGRLDARAPRTSRTRCATIPSCGGCSTRSRRAGSTR